MESAYTTLVPQGMPTNTDAASSDPAKRGRWAELARSLAILIGSPLTVLEFENLLTN